MKTLKSFKTVTCQVSEEKILLPVLNECSLPINYWYLPCFQVGEAPGIGGREIENRFLRKGRETTEGKLNCRLELVC